MGTAIAVVLKVLGNIGGYYVDVLQLRSISLRFGRMSTKGLQVLLKNSLIESPWLGGVQGVTLKGVTVAVNCTHSNRINLKKGNWCIKSEFFRIPF
jgi:hypothetical protein